MVWPITMPAARPAPVPAMPPSLRAASGSDSAVWYCVKRCMSPVMSMLMRRSSAACSSSGSVTLETWKLSSARPYCVNCGSSASRTLFDSSVWLAARSTNGTPDSPKAVAMAPMMTGPSCCSMSSTV